MPSAETLIRQGEAFFTKGKYREAAICFDQALQITPSDPEIWIRRATVYTAEGNLDKTIEDLRQALRLDPNLDGPRRFLNITEKRKIVRALVEEGSHGSVNFTAEELLNQVDEDFFAALRLEAIYLRYIGNVKAAYWLDYDIGPILTNMQFQIGMLKPHLVKRKPVRSHTDLALDALMDARSLADTQKALEQYPFITEEAFIHLVEQRFRGNSLFGAKIEQSLKWLRQIANKPKKSGWLSRLFGNKA
jgi:tetratricopeptide (TPR) repeat protein